MRPARIRTVAQIVSENIRTAHIFQKFDIDFSRNGNISLETAAELYGCNIDELRNELSSIENKVDSREDYLHWNVEKIIELILQQHIEFIKEKLPMLQKYAEKSLDEHGDNAPELYQVYQLVGELINETISHMKKEEDLLFPKILKLSEAKRKGQSPDKANNTPLSRPLDLMQHEHVEAGEIYKKIKTVTNNYQPPLWAIGEFRALYALLEEFENDLNQHVHIENNILFPKVIELENNIFG